MDKTIESHEPCPDQVMCVLSFFAGRGEAYPDPSDLFTIRFCILVFRILWLPNFAAAIADARSFGSCSEFMTGA
jgi:hypothetical protein